MGTKSNMIDPSKLVFREAEPRDHEGVKVLCRGTLGGRDILPAMYLHYLKDPLRKFYVAVYDGKVIALTGARIIDDGTMVEANSVRALPGTSGIFKALRLHSFKEWVMAEYPHIQRIRAVVRTPAAAYASPTTSTVPAVRVILDLAWKVPLSTIRIATDIYRKKFQSEVESRACVETADKEGVSILFEDTTFGDNYIPSRIIVVHNAPLHLQYKSNLELIVGDRKPQMFMSRNRHNQMNSISFGSAVEMGVTMETLRYTIDYYGASDINILTAHTMKHFSAIPPLLEHSDMATNVYVTMFLFAEQFDQNLLQQFAKFFSTELGIDNENAMVPAGRQFVIEAKNPLLQEKL